MSVVFEVKQSPTNNGVPDLMAAYDFNSDCGKFQFGLADWHFVIELAERYGWRPAGTVFPEHPDDMMFFMPDRDICEDEAEDQEAAYEDRLLRDYFSNSGQFVTDEDAANLATAIARALPDIPDHPAMRHKRKEHAMPLRVAKWCEIMPGPRPMPSCQHAVNAMEWFSGPEKRRLVEFTRFCKAGGFSIR